MTDGWHELSFRVLVQRVVVRVPTEHGAAFEARFGGPEDDGSARGTWHYQVERAVESGLDILEGGDRFARAVTGPQAADLLEERVAARVLDYVTRSGWVAVSGSLVEEDERRVLTIGADDSSVVLLRDGDAVALTIPSSYPGRTAEPRPLTDLAVAGGPVGPMPKAVAVSALLDAVRTDLSDGGRSAIRQVAAVLRDARATGLPSA